MLSGDIFRKKPKTIPAVSAEAGVKVTPSEQRNSLKLRLMILIPALLLSAFGIVMIYSASSYSAELDYGDPLFYVKKQLLGFVPGLVAMYGAYKLKPEFLKKAAPYLYFASLVLLAAVFIPGLGQTSYGATRWIDLGFITLQPSEIAKFALMLLLARLLADKPPVKFKNLVIPVLAVAAVLVLIMLEPNMSVTLCVAAAAFLVMFAAGLDKKYLIAALAAALALIPVLIMAEPYRVRRMLAFLDPWANPRAEGYQLIQSYYALGAGGIFGVGLFNSRQKYLFLPFAESDFIFSVIGEELGVVGCLVVLSVYAVMIYAGIKTAVMNRDPFRRLLAFGITAVIAVQTLLNVAVVTGSVPPTGVPLPFISAGGTSLIVFMSAAAVLMRLTVPEARIIFPNEGKAHTL